MSAPDEALMDRVRRWIDAHDTLPWPELMAGFAASEVAAERERADRAEAAAGAMREALLRYGRHDDGTRGAFAVTVSEANRVAY